MITLNVLGKSYTLKNPNQDQDLEQGAQKLQEVINSLEENHPKIPRDKLLVLAALNLAQIQGTTEVLKNSLEIQQWTSQLEELCDKIDLSVKENINVG